MTTATAGDFRTTRYLAPEAARSLRSRFPVCRSSRYADDPAARAFVAAHPGGATLEEVGAAFGVTREAIRQIEERALVHFARRFAFATQERPW